MTAARSIPLRPRKLVPEVVQTSAMDCGPAALKCILAGFGVQVSYGRLRDACQTDIDGTSIDTVEAVAQQLGFDAEQVLLPVDHVLVPESAALPAVMLVRLPNGFTHFVVVWSCHGPFVQVMDPASGRRFMRRDELLDSVYVHLTPIDAEAFRDWAGSEPFLAPLRHRLAQIGCRREGALHVQAALEDGSHRGIARLDAATRMVEAIVRSRGLRRGAQAAAALDALLRASAQAESESTQVIPDVFWTVRPISPSDADPGEDSGATRLLARGAVLVSVRAPEAGRVTLPESPASDEPHDRGASPSRASGAALAPALRAALAEAPARPGRHLLRTLLRDGPAMPALLALGVLLSGAGVALEALLLRGLFDLGWSLRLLDQRIAALALLLGFGLLLLLLEWPVAAGLLRLGRRLETRLRIAFLERMPRVDERYFESRPTSDIAERSHAIHRIRLLPGVVGRGLRCACELLATTAGIVWLDPGSALPALLAGAAMLIMPGLLQPLLSARDLRVRTHAAAMSRFNLDALLGLTAVRASGAERALRREHESLLLEWARAARSCLRVVITVDALQAAVGYGLCAWLFIGHLARVGDVATPLLLLYWTLNLPVLGQELGLIARQVPLYRNLTLRLLELLNVPVRSELPQTNAGPEAHLTPTAITRAARPEAREAGPELGDELGRRGTAIELRGVHVRAAGHSILEDIDLQVAPSSHIAIVGASGAGKSSLMGLLLGFHQPAAGSLRVDGRELDAAGLCALRTQIAWVDPAVQLWNRSLLDNLRYGATGPQGERGTGILHAADLRSVLEKMPLGLQTPLGENGGLLSGGEGQRVRFGRALQRPFARLVLLDEPFRGLDRERRTELLARARALYSHATLLCITHDLHETREFSRVLVMEQGRLVEDGAPAALEARPGSRYRALLQAEDSVRAAFWTDPSWRRLRMHHGRLSEGIR